MKQSKLPLAFWLAFLAAVLPFLMQTWTELKAKFSEPAKQPDMKKETPEREYHPFEDQITQPENNF